MCLALGLGHDVSPASDYDVCFLFANPDDSYGNVQDGKELIDLLL